MTYPQFPTYGSGPWQQGAGAEPSLAAQAADPATTPEQMRVIIQQDPSLSAVVAVNPSVDDALREWLWEYGGDDVRQAMTAEYERALQAQQAQQFGQVQQSFDSAPVPSANVAVEPVAPFGAEAGALAADTWYQESAQMIDSVPGFGTSEAEPAAAQHTPATEPQSQNLGRSQEAAFEPQHAESVDDDVEKTVLVRRNHRPSSRILLESGDSVEIDSDVAILGRNPRGAISRRAQIIRIPDAHKTISKTHAKLEWIDGGWFITDLESTNGVTIGPTDTEAEITPNTATPLEGQFALGLYRLELVVDR